MKKAFYLLLFISLIILNGCGNNEDKLNWDTNLEHAIQTAAKENKAVLVNFTGSDWCKWCKKLNAEVFSKDDFINFAKTNLVLVKIDFPQNIEQTPAVQFYNNQLAQKFRVEGYPTIVILNSSGRVLGYTGYQDGGAAKYVNHLKSYLM